VKSLTFGASRPHAAVALQADGKVVVASTAAPGMARLPSPASNADGTPDVGFGLAGLAAASLVG
jgi:hypothetical protein